MHYIKKHILDCSNYTVGFWHINFVFRLQSTYHWQCYTDFLNGYNLCCHQTEYMSPIVRPQGCTDLLCDLQLE
jgi:hypothetical protein